MGKINQEDALYVIKKTSREDALKAAQREGRVSFVYAEPEEVKKLSEGVVKLLRPTLNELKYR